MKNFAVLSLLKNAKWGGWALICLYVSLFSGIVVGIQYEHTTPYYSTASIDLIVPFGGYFRSLHFYSSQFFFLFSCIHLVFVYSETEKYTRGEWIKLTTTLPVALLLLFTGYILRGDSTGSSAGIIAENIVLAIPLIGTALNDILFSITESGMRKVYLNHVISFDLLLLIFLWTHLRKHRVFLKDHLFMLSAALCLPILILAPLEPDQLGVSYISGPWFFLGLQEILHYFSPLLAGVIAPLCFLIAIYTIRPKTTGSRFALTFTGIWLFVYTLLSLIAYFRSLLTWA